MPKPHATSKTAPMKGASKAADVQKSLPTVTVPLKQILLDDNYRQDMGDLESLAESIDKHGLLQAVFLRVVGKGQYQVVAGERRVRAHAFLKRTHIEAKVASDMPDKLFFELKLLENLQRKDPHPLETAEGFQKALDAGSTAEELAESTGQSVSSIRACLKLLNLCPAGRKLYLSGKVLTQSTALYVARIPNHKVQEALLAELKQLTERNDGEPPSARLVNDLVHRDYLLLLTKAPFDVKASELVKGVGACGACPKRSGNDPLFKDTKNPDLCTDKVCWSQKCDASWTLAKQAASTAGKGVLSEKDAAKVFNQYNGSLAYDAPYVFLDAKCSDDPKQRTYKQLLREVVKDRPELVTVARSPSGRPESLLPRAGLAKLLKSAGHDFKKERAAEDQAARERAEKREERSEAGQARNARAQAQKDAIERVLAVAQQRPMAETLSLLAELYDVREWLEFADDFWARPGQEPLEAFEKRIPSLAPEAFVNLLLADALYSGDTYSFIHGRPAEREPEFIRACRRFGVEVQPTSGVEELVLLLDDDAGNWRIEPVASNSDHVHLLLRHEETDARMPATWWPAAAKGAAARLEYGHAPDTAPGTPESQAQAAFWVAHPAFVAALVERISDGDGDLPTLATEDVSPVAPASDVAVEADVPTTTAQTSAQADSELRSFRLIDGWSVEVLGTTNAAGLPEVLLRDDVGDSVIGRFAYGHGKLKPADPEHLFLQAWVEEHANIIEELTRGIASGKVPSLFRPAVPAASADVETSAPEAPAPKPAKSSRRQRV
ncbi:ParB/RepB/Spo0J family partition protein [Pyxidicoccus sp. MSG2]|uniref:ParB/RepB/Spo0J family partition protein n=1 Tax=Pyxidicoccus sp. MSG2 TaxID=2996790 RepID=UPI00226FEAFE|nr:ParB/RepB/Spo0J family partition protein [Pyxidicoccus sp. MSG2]MCY1023956.1 ParB/RepB/Spo0J family partition protein [Pyxidicoccus sp. MSG2]